METATTTKSSSIRNTRSTERHQLPLPLASMSCESHSDSILLIRVSHALLKRSRVCAFQRTSRPGASAVPLEIAQQGTQQESLRLCACVRVLRAG